jgi:N-methylhydantoinase A/oxoprolinase/acetone carboxylase beta subunit
MHSYTYRKHEEQIGQLCEQMGFEQISISSKYALDIHILIYLTISA